MGELPRALSPWAEKLAVLQRELALELGPWIQRLSAAIGPLSTAHQPDSGEPDGYDGITLRGPYDRLLPTEWLYTDVAPEEFLRRASSGEHTFYRLAAKEPQAARRCVVIFDSGPSQLGTPRIAHLASLIVFASRCEAAHAELWWGTVQAGPESPQVGFAKEQAERLLAARSAHEVTQSQLDVWLADRELDGADVWLIGSPRFTLLRASRRVSRLEIHDVTEPDVRRLDLTLMRPAQAPRRLELPLPAADACTRLLRAPFALPKPAPPRNPPRGSLRLARGLVFSRASDRLFSRDLNGDLVIIGVPSHAHQWSVRPRVVAVPGEVPVAAGWAKGPIAVTAKVDGQGLAYQYSVHHLNKRGVPRRSPEVFLTADDAARFTVTDGLLPAVMQRENTQARVLVPMPHGLLTLRDHHASFDARPLQSWLERDSTLLLLATTPYGEKPELLFERLFQKPKFQSLDAAGTGRGLLGHGRLSQVGVSWAWNPNASPLQWTLNLDGAPGLTRVESGTVMGLTGNPGSALGPGLIVRSEDRLELFHCRAEARTKLATTLSPITFVALDPHLPRVAWLEMSGALGLMDLTGHARVRRAGYDAALNQIDFTPFERVGA